MNTPSTAATRIRQHVEALPEELRVPWQHEVRGVIAAGEAWAASAGPWAHAPAVARHIALLASPDVATALEEHLKALDDWDAAEADDITQASIERYHAACQRLRETTRTLTAAICREAK